MGVAISYRFGQKKCAVKNMLDWAEKGARVIEEEYAQKEGISIKIRRISDFKLLIDIGQCETVGFDFRSVKDILAEAEKDWSYAYEALTDGGKRELDEGYKIAEFPQNEIYYSADFTKTQFCGKMLEHKWVADLVRIVAGYCLFVEVNDEGDYYHTGKLGDAQEAIKECGAMISGLTGTLKKLGFDEIKSGKTKIK